jgi:hypothetical protein
MNDAFATTSEAALDDLGSDFAPAPIGARQGNAEAAGPAETLTQAGKILLDSAQLRQLRQSRLLSQQDLADDCWRRNIRVSIATIKRAESGHAVRFRIARELARCFDVPVMRILSSSVAAAN